jgi:YHS domain-containing protein
VYGNRLVRFCCKMCKAGFNKDPDAYLAKINTAVAEAQATDYPTDTCVVSGDKFGGDMGEPVDYVIGTRLVRFCCPMCVKQFEANPARYLSKLDGGDSHGGDGHGEHHDQDGDAHGHANHH